MRKTQRNRLFYLLWLLLLLIPPTALLIWMNDPYVHTIEISDDSVRATGNRLNAAETPAYVRVSNSSDDKHQAFAVNLADGIGISAILIRRWDVHETPPRLDHPRDDLEQGLVVDDKPRKRRILEVVILGLLALALFLSFWLKPMV